MDCNPPGSSIHRISQARILEWVAISFLRGSSPPRDQTCISCIGRWILYPRSSASEERQMNQSSALQADSLVGVRRNPQVPHTAREVTCHPVNNWRGRQSSIPPHKTRPDSPVRTLQRNCDPSQIWPRGSQERKHEFPASTRDEALFHCTKPSGVPRGPSQLHSIPDFSEAPLDLPVPTEFFYYRNILMSVWLNF